MENQGIDQGLFNGQFIQPWPFPSIQSFNPCQYPSGNEYYPAVSEHDGLFTSTTPSSMYGGVSCGGGMSSSDQLGFGGFCNIGSTSSTSAPFGNLHAELISKMSAQEIMDAKAQAASKSHSEAERRRRERINAHLARLRGLLPSTTKTDKASLLAEVIVHLKELKRQMSEMADETNPLPTETNELTLDATNNDDGRFIVKASLCCEDQSDLIPELIKALKSLRLRTLKAEIMTLGGRVKNILVITGEDESDQREQLCISSIQDALKAVMERSTAADESYSVNGSVKRQRTNNLSSLLQRSL